MGGAPALQPDAYARAERFLLWNADRYCRNLDIAPHWIGDTDRFWCALRTRNGRKFVIVDATSGEQSAAFDHVVLARGLSAALRRQIEPHDLPLSGLEFLDESRAIGVSVEGVAGKWLCGLSDGRCAKAVIPEENLGGLLSPDSRWAVFSRSHDIWLRSMVDGAERRLTFDAEAHYGYGTTPGSSAALRSLVQGSSASRIPSALWAPDSSKFLTYRLDERQVLDLNLLEAAPNAGVRPVLHSYRYAMPGDVHKPHVQLTVFDAETGHRTDVCHEPIPVTMLDPIRDDRVWWGRDGDWIYFVPREEGQKRAQLLKSDVKTGETRLVIEERGRTYVEIGGTGRTRAIRTLSDGRIIWYSERDDWGHLYIYDAAGRLIRQLTSGAWKVLDVARVDEVNSCVYFTAVGREPREDPYQRHLYVVNLDGSALRPLTPENADHDIRIASSEHVRNSLPVKLDPGPASFSPSGRYFVATYSRPDLSPVTVLRSTTGGLISVVARADVAALESGGFRLPEPFSVLAADGQTQLYGTIFRPSVFDPALNYPVIDVIYPGPQRLGTAKGFKAALYDLYRAISPQALAEIGFIVVTIDGRGTPLRSKSFHDISYGKMANPGHLEDHVAGIRQLAARYDYMDLERVGITGHSGGGFASTRAMLLYPDFYKVAVSLSGNHDQRGYLSFWGPTYQGPYASAEYETLSNAQLAANLKGRLLLMHGELDDNVHPALTLQVVAALIRANKEFECLVLPGEDHMFSNDVLPYIHRKAWDFFARNLLGLEPPCGYEMATPGSPPPVAA